MVGGDPRGVGGSRRRIGPCLAADAGRTTTRRTGESIARAVWQAEIVHRFRRQDSLRRLADEETRRGEQDNLRRLEEVCARLVELLARELA